MRCPCVRARTIPDVGDAVTSDDADQASAAVLAAKYCEALSRQSHPLNLISKLNQRVFLRGTIAALSSSHWSLKLEVIYER
jgi:hypothetical protein